MHMAQAKPDALHSGLVLESLSWAVRHLMDQPERFFQTVRAFLGTLRRASGMEAVELFLADPAQRHLVLSVHEGQHVRAFLERAAFAFGEGYPGLVARDHAPIVTHDLGSDARYLRQQVKALGYCTYVCAPLELPHRLIGVVNLASRDPKADEHGAFELLCQVGPMLATGLYTVLTHLGETSLMALSEAVRGGRQSAGFEAMLEHAVRFARASHGVIQFRDGRRVGTLAHAPACPALETCPVWQGRIASVRTGALTCEVVHDGLTRYCLPLSSGERVVGVESLYFTHAPSPPTASLVPLLWLERLTGPLLERPISPVRAAPWLEIETFGAFRVRRNGALLGREDIGRQKAWTLLRILVAHRGRALVRDELSERLWPEASPEAGRNRLHGLVHALREALEPDPQRPQVILREGETYRFDPQLPHALDVADFERLVHQADQLDGTEALEAYWQAIALYRGEFMEDEPYADWCELERSYLREQTIRALGRTAELLVRLERLEDSASAYRHALTLDPWREDTYLALAGVLEQSGQTRAAEAVLEGYRKRLVRDGLTLKPV
jgi:DNA-binding SARP family transcriptional activator